MKRAEGRPYRVLMTADAVGGVWPYALSLAQGFGERAQVLLAVMGPPPDGPRRRAAAAIPGLRLAIGPYRLEWMARAEAHRALTVKWLRALARSFVPDVIHVNGYGLAAERWPAPVVVVGHSCVLSWWIAVHRQPAPPSWSRYAGRVASGLASAQRVVAPSEAMLGALRQHYGLPRGGTVIANGCDPATGAPCRKEKFVLAAGRFWDEGKNLAALDAAAARLPWPVWVAGDCCHPDGHIGAPGTARSLGPLAADELRRWMARAAIYALPARYEPFGLSVLEAAQAGCALVLGDIPSLRENWQGAAVFVPPDDSAALAEAIAGLMGEDGRRAGLAAAAARRARRFSTAAMTDRYLELYAALAGFRNATPMPVPAGVEAV